MQERKLKRIGLLMLLSELVLMLFIGGWIWGQYELQETRMDKDLRLAFEKSSEKLGNAILDITVDSLLKGNAKAFRVNATQGGFHAYATTSVIATDSGGKASAPGLPAIRIQHGAAPLRVDSATVLTYSSDPPFVLSDSAHSPQVRKILRVVLNQVSGNAFIKTAIDTAALKSEFLKTAQHNYARLNAAWEQDSFPKLFRYFSPDHPDRALSVTGYKPYLLWAILPQIAFTLFLLSLTGIAFWMAYRNMKRQLRFAAQKDSFISNISHELKTPVATTRVALEALSTYHAINDPDRTKRYLKVAMLEMDRLGALISSVLDTMQTEQGLLQLKKEEIPLAALIEEVSETLSPVLQQYKVTLITDLPDHNITAKGDKVHLSGVLYNLMDNAAKYGAGLIKVSMRTEQGCAAISVMNNGAGIAPEYHEKVFEKFFRIPSGNEHTVKGHGLGLSYAQYVMRAHSGNINLECMNDETIFTITLPKS